MRRQPWARTFTLLVRIVNQTIASHRLSPLLNLITVPRPRPPALALATANDQKCQPPCGYSRAVHFSTTDRDIHVTYRKEQPIGAISAVRARTGTRPLMSCIVLHLGRTFST